jgi:hypothetical protein
VAAEGKAQESKYFIGIVAHTNKNRPKKKSARKEIEAGMLTDQLKAKAPP